MTLFFANKQQWEVELIASKLQHCRISYKKHRAFRTRMDCLERRRDLAWSTGTDFGERMPELPLHTYFSTLYLTGSERVTWTVLQWLIPGKGSNTSIQGGNWTSETENGNYFASSYETSAERKLKWGESWRSPHMSPAESFQLLWLRCCYVGS